MSARHQLPRCLIVAGAFTLALNVPAPAQSAPSVRPAKPNISRQTTGCRQAPTVQKRARFPHSRVFMAAVPGLVGGPNSHAADTAPPPRPAPGPIVVTPKDRVLLQRGFVPVEGALRLYACVVGTPAGVHYAYDFETGALLSVWRGPFADLVEMWGPRARNQTARPAGREIMLTAKPLLAQFPDRPMFEFPRAWPVQPAALYSYHGYELEDNGQPVFRAKLEDLALRDRIAPSADGRGLTRRLEFSGRLPAWETWLLLAEAGAITPRGGGRGWSAGQPGWTVEWPADSPHQPGVRTEGKRQQLVLRLERANLDRPVAYTIRW